MQRSILKRPPHPALRATFSPLWGERVRPVLLALLLLFVFALPAYADPPPPLSALAGEWAIRTAPHRYSGCVITANARAVHRARARKLDIDLDVTAECPEGGVWRARETCVGAIAAARVEIACTLISATPGNYIADSFTLEAVSPTFMSGRLHDAEWWNEPVEWRRRAAPLIS